MKDMMMSYEELAKMDRAWRNELLGRCTAILERQEMNEEWDIAYACYSSLCAIEDEEYRAENMDAFKAYEARMGEPDFDWSYYSDWHKDMFGYRPHFKAIPANEDERQRMCDAWHKARGL